MDAQDVLALGLGVTPPWRLVEQRLDTNRPETLRCSKPSARRWRRSKNIPSAFSNVGRQSRVWESHQHCQRTRGGKRCYRQRGYCCITMQARSKRPLSSKRRVRNLDTVDLGIAQMANVIDKAGGGHMRIFSGQGEVQYRLGGGFQSHNHRYHIGGTLIEWSLPCRAFGIPEEEEND